MVFITDRGISLRTKDSRENPKCMRDRDKNMVWPLFPGNGLAEQKKLRVPPCLFFFVLSSRFSDKLAKSIEVKYQY